jgi:glycosyltransferase involved in cell wall biosynthesis
VSDHPTWSRHYVEVVERFPEYKFLLIGAPPSLIDRLRLHPNVLAHDVFSDDERLRTAYSSADHFLHMADRGESFGNVILESILCGTPVISLARPFRDNSPWEFQSLNGFDFVSNLDQVHQKLIQKLAYGRTELSRDRAAIVGRYSPAAVSTLLRQSTSQSASNAREKLAMSLPDLMKISIRHNPISEQIKRVRLSLR